QRPLQNPRSGFRQKAASFNYPKFPALTLRSAVNRSEMMVPFPLARLITLVSPSCLSAIGLAKADPTSRRP
ncbi:MAG TPA: hypothetical protein VNZ25_03700, partial [Candidatus Angelobacter sp.]|nr:hypothetical protein [Candidatus Angelobacter sp.]